jgi:uncharacterized membrane protein YtjA (UPF0391 family)
MLANVLSSVPVLAQSSAPSVLLWWALAFFVIALLAYVLGARGFAGMSAGIGRTLLFVFLIVAVLFVLIGLFGRTV